MTPDAPRTSLLIDLAYELLDAHSDAMALGSQNTDPAWQAHVDYVRVLQRRGREILALSAHEAAPEESSVHTPIRDSFE